MRKILVLAAATLVAPAASAQPTGYFDISAVQISELGAPDWGRRVDGNRVLFLCIDAEKCPPPTAIEVKGVTRAETLPAGFDKGPLSPAFLKQQGEARASNLGSRFLSAEPYAAGGVRGVAMEASADLGGQVFFVTRWLGQGNRLLDIKVTARDLAQGRALAQQAVDRLVPQVFGK